MPPKQVSDAASGGDEEDTPEYDNYTNAEALEEYFHGKRDQRSGKHGVKLHKKLSARKSGSLRKSGSAASSLSANAHPLRASKSNHSGKPKHFQNSTVDEMMEAHVAGDPLVSPTRASDASRPSGVDQHKYEMEKLGKILDMFDMKGKFGAKKEADVALNGDAPMPRAQPIVNYSRRLSSSMNSSGGAAHFTASSPLLPEATRMSVPAFRSVHRLPSASDLELSHSPSHPSLPALVTPPRPSDTPRTDLTETPSAAGTPGTTAVSPTASSLRLAPDPSAAAFPEQTDSFMTAASTPPESVHGTLSRPPSSGSFLGQPPGQPAAAPGRSSASAAVPVPTPQPLSGGGGGDGSSLAARGPEVDARPSNQFLILAGTSSTDPALITKQHAAGPSKSSRGRRKKARDTKEGKETKDALQPQPVAAGRDRLADGGSDLAAAVPMFADSGPRYVIADASAAGPVSAIVPADSVAADVDVRPTGERPEGPADDAESGAAGWAPARGRRKPHRSSRPSSMEPRKDAVPGSAGVRMAASGGANERRSVTKPAPGERGFARSLTDSSRRRSRSNCSAEVLRADGSSAGCSGGAPGAAGAYAAGVTMATQHTLAHAYAPPTTFPVAPAPPVQQPLLLPSAAGGAPSPRRAASRRSTPWGGRGTDGVAAPHSGGASARERMGRERLAEPAAAAAPALLGSKALPAVAADVAVAPAAPPPAAASMKKDERAVTPPTTSAAIPASTILPTRTAAPMTTDAASTFASEAAARPSEDLSQPGHDRHPQHAQPLVPTAPEDSVPAVAALVPTAVPALAPITAPAVQIPFLTSAKSVSSEAPTPLAFPAATGSFFAGTAPLPVIPTSAVPVVTPALAYAVPTTAVVVATPGLGTPMPFMATNQIVSAPVEAGGPFATTGCAPLAATLLTPASGHTPFGSPMPTPALPSGILPPSPPGTAADGASVGRISANSSARVPDGLVGDMSLDETDLPAIALAATAPATADEHTHGAVFPGASYAADVMAAAQAQDRVAFADELDEDDAVAGVPSAAQTSFTASRKWPSTAMSHAGAAADSESAQQPEGPCQRSRDLVFAAPAHAALPVSTESRAGTTGIKGSATGAAHRSGEASAVSRQEANTATLPAFQRASLRPSAPVTSPSRWADIAALHSPAPATAARHSRHMRPAPSRGSRSDFHGFQAAPPPQQHAAAPAVASLPPASQSPFGGTAGPPAQGGRRLPKPPAGPLAGPPAGGSFGLAQHAQRLPSTTSSKGSVGAAVFSGAAMGAAGLESSGVSAVGGSSAGVLSRASSSAGAERSPVGHYPFEVQNPFQTAHLAAPLTFSSPRDVIRGSPFAVSSPTRRTATAPSTAADSMQASSIDTIGGRSPIAPASHERPIESTLNAVRETMESHRMEPFRLWTVELPLEWHVLAIDVVLRVVEASMIAALNDSSAAASSDVLGTSGGDRGSLGGRGLSWSGGGGSSSVDSRGVSNGVSGSHGANGVTGDAGEVGAEADDMYRGNETLAAFTLHHCMHVSLQGYALLNPFKHRSSQGATVDCEDDRLPYPAGSGAALYEFRKKALPFTRMDVTSAAAKSTLSGFSQLEADTRETANDGPGHIHSGEDDNLFHRLKAVCTTVLHQHVQRAIEDGDPAVAVVGFQQVLERLERFIALDDAQDSLSLHRLAGAGGDHDNIVLVFDTPDDKMRPPVVAHFIIWLLGRLLELTRDLACTAVDAFDRVTGPSAALRGRGGKGGGGAAEDGLGAWRDAQAHCVQEVLLRWSRLSNMAASVCLQISRRLLRRERLERFGRRFRSDSIIWSTVLLSANIMFVMGWVGPGPQPLQRMGLLKHVPYALCDGARLTTEGVPSAAAGSSKEYPHLSPLARNIAHDTNELLMRIISGQLNAMTSGLRVLKTALERGHPEAEAGPRASADEPEAALQREAALRATVEQWQSLRRDSQTRQLATFVKNLDSFFDIMINIVHMRENFEKERILQDVEYIKSESYINLKRDLAETFKWFLAFLLDAATLYLMYFDREWVYDRASQQFKERSSSGGYHAFRRGVTEATIRALLQQLNNACYIIQSLRDTEKRCVVTDTRRSGGASDSAEPSRSSQLDSEHVAARLPHVWDRLTLRLNDILSPRVPTLYPQATPEPSTSVQSDRMQAALGLRNGSSRSGSAPTMPTLEELTHEIIVQRTLPADETYVAQTRSTLGIICKHIVEPLLQDCAHQLPVPVAIKWINVHVDSRAHESGRGGLSSAQRWALLSAEVSTLKRLRDSLQGPVPVTEGYPAAPPHSVRLEEANVVIYLTVHASDLKLEAIRILEDPGPTQLVQVAVNKRVGTVMEWLPNGSVKDLLGEITAKELTLQAAMDAVAWARSTRTPAPPMPPQLANRSVADVFTMPCDVTALEEIGGAAYMRAVIPPERSTSKRAYALRRVLDSEPAVHRELDIFRSRYGTFRQQVPFPACKEPLAPGGKSPAAEGGSAKAELVRGAVPVLLLSFKWTLQLLLQAAKGVALCHRIGIAHRDLEPWNLMFDRFGRIKIIDFGDSLNQMRQIHGSAGPLSHELYLAPEVRMWDNFEPHHHTTGDLLRPAGDAEVLATDIWTLGVVFWQMLTLHLVKTLGAIPAAGQSMDRLRDELVHYEGCASHHDERQDALCALRRCGISEHAAERELARVPPLPFDPSYLRPAVFADSPAGHAQHAAWHRKDAGGGYQRLRKLIVSMLGVHHSLRPNALQVAQQLNELLNDFRDMM